VFSAHERGALRECFGTGTAATLSQVRRIRHRDREISLPPIEDQQIGTRLRELLTGIATGQVADRYGWLEKVAAP
jgi:branched-chain amino acid aminotransferase